MPIKCIAVPTAIRIKETIKQWIIISLCFPLFYYKIFPKCNPTITEKTTGNVANNPSGSKGASHHIGESLISHSPGEQEEHSGSLIFSPGQYKWFSPIINLS